MSFSNQRKLKIFLGDFDHFLPGNRISIPYNIASIASYCKSVFGEEIEIELFKNAEELINRVSEASPDILALSFYMWNANLTLKIIECCKVLAPRTLTVIGGPSIGRNDKNAITILNKNPSLDIIVIDQGERSFAAVVERVLSKGVRRRYMFIDSIKGCLSRVHDSTSIVRGEKNHNIKGLETIPSPYLSGDLDRFLEEGFQPQLESTRGCPYKCTFCGYGDSFFSKMIKRDEDVIREELQYMAARSKTRELSITDANWGMLKGRDLRLSQFMLSLKKQTGFPLVTDWASSKVKNDETFKVMKIMAQLNGRYYFGVQTLTEEALSKSKRKNISFETMKSLVDIARGDDMPVVCDLIFGLPGETVESFMNTTSQLSALGIQNPGVYQLRLLPGSPMEEEVEKYQMSTKFRPFNNRLGEYRLLPGKKPERIVEVEEIVTKNYSFDFSDYLSIREYGMLVELLGSYGAFSETITYLASRGIDIVEIIKVIQKGYKQYPLLSELFEKFNEYTKSELYDTEEDLCRDLTQTDEAWNNFLTMNGNHFKIALGFVGYFLFHDSEILETVSEIIKTGVKEKLSVEEVFCLNQVLRRDSLLRITSGRIEEKARLSNLEKEYLVKETFNFNEWKKNKYSGDINDYKFETLTNCLYYIDNFEGLLEKAVQYQQFDDFNFYEKIILYAPRKALKRNSRLAPNYVD